MIATRFSGVIALGVLFCLTGVIQAQPTTSPTTGPSAAILVYEPIYQVGTAPFPSCHASTIVETRSGLVAAFFGGTNERYPDVCIWVTRRDGNKWGPLVEVANGIQPGDAPRLPTWNPVLFQPKGGPLYLFYKVGPSPSLWWGEVKTSNDDGKTWSEARKLGMTTGEKPMPLIGPVKNKPIVLPDGTWLAGASRESMPGWLVHFELSKDSGKTWESIGPVDKGPQNIEGIQPSILTYADGRLQAMGRTKNGFLFSTWSKDNGKTWSTLEASKLPNPSSGTDAVTLADGRQLMVYNHSGPDPNNPSAGKGQRTPLDVAISTDGVEWKHVATLESDPRGSFAYPAVIQSSDGLVHVTWTWNRRTIKYAVLDPKKL